VPETEALLPRFRAAHTQVLGVSVDSVYSHANWGRDLGGVSFPLLADFEPKGAAGRAFGAYLDGPGLDDRATVIIDRGGIVRYAESVTPAGRRDIGALAAECERIDQAWEGDRTELPTPEPCPGGAVLYVKSGCGASRAALLAKDNLHIQEALLVRNVTEDPEAHAALVALAGKDQAPCLVVDGDPMHESAAIVARLASICAPV